MTVETPARGHGALFLMLVVATIVLAACGGGAPQTAKPAQKGAGEPAAQAGGSGGAVQGGTVQGDADAGRALFSTRGCIACHVAPGVPGATGTIGPSLAGIGDPARKPTLADGGANTPERIKTWIQDPQRLKPGTLMPNLGLSDQEASDLTAFLLTLK